jgi:hypothetical protein
MQVDGSGIGADAVVDEVSDRRLRRISEGPETFDECVRARCGVVPALVKVQEFRHRTITSVVSLMPLLWFADRLDINGHSVPIPYSAERAKDLIDSHKFLVFPIGPFMRLAESSHELW